MWWSATGCRGRSWRCATGSGWSSGTAGTWRNSTVRGRAEVMRRVMMTIAGGVSWCTLALAAHAQAAGQGERVGERVGELLGGWARSLYIGIAAIVALVF